MGSSVVRIQWLWQAGVPIPFPRHRQSTQQVVKGSVEPFTLTIARRMVGSSARFSDVIEAAKLLDKNALKVSALVGMYPGWDTELGEPFCDQNLSHSGSSLITGKLTCIY